MMRLYGFLKSNASFLQKNGYSISDFQLMTSILLFWLAAEYAHGNYNIEAVKDCKIEIFK